MTKLLLATLASSLLLFAHTGLAEDHSDEHAHGEHEEESESEQTEGFKLAPEAVKTFGLKYRAAPAGSSFTISRKSIYFGLHEQNLYRLREGLFKRIDFQVISKSKTEFKISTSELKAGDQIVIEGIGFLRMAELAASGGVSESHSH